MTTFKLQEVKPTLTCSICESLYEQGRNGYKHEWGHFLFRTPIMMLSKAIDHNKFYLVNKDKIPSNWHFVLYDRRDWFKS